MNNFKILITFDKTRKNKLTYNNVVRLIILYVINIISIIFFISSNEVHANNKSFKFKHYSISDGLSLSYVNDIIQDRKGYIWIATSNGLNRFDGYNFKIYKNIHLDNYSIANNDTHCLYEDSNGYIWIGLTDGFISKYNPQTEKFTNYSCLSNDTDDVLITGITEDSNGIIWISSNKDGIFSINPNTGNTSHYYISLSNNTPANNSLTSIALGIDNNIWVTSWGGGLYSFNPQTQEFKYFKNQSNDPNPKKCDFLTCQHHDHKNNIWLGNSYRGLYCFNTKTNKWTHYYNTNGTDAGLNNETVNNITNDEQGNLWISTKKGISILDTKNNKFKHITSGNNNWNLSTNIINLIYSDKLGGIWIGTNNGIYFYNPLMLNFKTYDIREWERSVHDGYIYSVLKTKSGDILLKGNGELFIFNEKNGKFKTLKPNNASYKNAKKMILFEDKNNILWIGYTGNIIGKYNLKTNKYEEITMKSPNNGCIPFRNVNTFYEDNDSSIWIGTEIGLLNYKPNNKTFKSLFQSKDLIYSENKVNSILRVKNGDLWIGTNKGIKRYDKNNKLIHHYIVKMNDKQSISNNIITSIYQDKTGEIWIGTRGGLHHYNNKNNSFTLIKRPTETLGDPIMGIVEDESENLWLSSTIGIIRFNYKTKSIHLYNEADGLQSNEFNMGVFSKGLDGEIFFGGINGINSFYPQSIKTDTFTPYVYITDFKIFNKSINPDNSSILKSSIGETKKIELKHWQSTFSFDFVAIDYIAPSNNKFAYKLEGFDNQWIYTSYKNRTATYTNIQPGKYIFKVKASNGDDIWNEKGVEIEIKVLPPIWKTWWAYILYTLIIISIIITTFYYYINKERRKTRIELERIEAKRQHELDELKLQLFANISHEFRTSLTLILGPMEHIKNKLIDVEGKAQFEVMQRSGNRLMRLINQLLDFRKLEANKMTVTPTSQDIVSFMKEIYGIFTYHAKLKDINYSFHSSIDNLNMSFDKDKLDKIIYNLLSNAFNYTSSGGNISVTLDKTYINNKLFISISIIDNGIGIPKEDVDKIFTLFYQSKTKEPRKNIGTGLGLNLTKELTKMLGGDIDVKSELGKGSSFTITIPYSEPLGSNDGRLDAVIEKVLDTDIKQVGNFTEKHGIILVVEDNNDMRFYIKSILGSSFKIVEAENGIEGFDKALEYIPDIIISDIMMPEMDGTELLEKIKSDERTNHIPVILLTAINEEKQILKTLNIGVDDYITKPFNPDILEARINNILSNRKKLWERYENIFKKTDENTTDSDKGIIINPFIEKLTEIIKSNLANYDFNLDSLSSELCMSSSQLIRKTKALMNITPYNLIIKMRMEYAANEILKSDKTINEIAFECGYQEKSNFSRAFTKYYGINPLQYKKNSGKK